VEIGSRYNDEIVGTCNCSDNSNIGAESIEKATATDKTNSSGLMGHLTDYCRWGETAY